MSTKLNSSKYVIWIQNIIETLVVFRNCKPVKPLQSSQPKHQTGKKRLKKQIVAEVA